MARWTMIIDSQIRPTRFAIKILFTTSKSESKVCLCVKLFDYFPMSILIRWTWNLSRFVLNSVEILIWNEHSEWNVKESESKKENWLP